MFRDGLRRMTRVALALAFLAGLALTPMTARGQDDRPAEFERYAAGEIVIGWRPENSTVPAALRASASDSAIPDLHQAAEALARLTGLPVLDAQAAGRGFARLAVLPGRELVEIERLQLLPWVAYAEPNYIVRAAGDARYPTDPNFGQQWYLRRIAAPGAWAVTQGDTAIVVAVVDSGLDLAHPEFPAWRVVSGWDYVRGDNIPDDENGHGTHVAGILAAATDNGQGISGLAPYVRIRPLKVLDKDGRGYQAAVARAIYDAVDETPAAKIINLSLGGPTDTGTSPLTLKEAVDHARGKGALVVAAAGNCAQPVQECGYQVNPDFYPAAYDGVLAVAASDHYDNWAFYSGYKPYIGIAAPGGIQADAIWSTLPGGYGFMHGTSMAAPLVSAAAALVWSAEPSANAQNVADFLKSTADKVGTNPFTGLPIPYVGGRNDYFGYGRLNVMKAVRWALAPSLQPITAQQTFLLGGPLTQSTQTLTIRNPSDQSVLWQATVTSGSDWLRITPATGSTSYTTPGTLSLQAGPVALAPGLYTGIVRVTSLYPGWLPGFDIPVELRVSDTISQVFLPLIMHQRWMPDWYDPFGAGGPPRALVLAGDGVTTETLPFPVSFFGGVFSQVHIAENGLVFFGAGSSATLAAPTSCPPTAAAPNNALYALARDWQLSFGGQVYVHQPDADTYVITWYQVRRAADTPHNSFQIAFRRSGAITAHYLAVEPLLNPMVGAENYDGTYAQMIACNGVGRTIVGGDVLPFEPSLPW